MIHALEAGQFLVYYQPKFTLQDLQVDSLELLARWNHPRLGLLSPSRFLPTLERLGLLDRLLHQQIDQCLHFRQQAKTYGFDFKFSINIQTFQLASEGLFDAVSTRLRAFDTPGTCLCFEMTETDAQTLTPMNLENLVRLRMLGCVLSIDDFGAGHSSLQRLCTLPFNEIKLDGLFVRELNATSRSGVAITSTLQIADALGIDVVIEGIETQEQRTQLINLGCRLGQGYYFAMPMPATKLLVWLFNKVFQDYLSTVRRRLLSLPPP
ncbi:EAL domain-containing protein [Pseudomonas sp. S10E 269]|uniref:EAL domain-containing protein n=1 Tax=Pseudomonas sp. S10E 269 TaxID=2054917 RepID=UPI0012FDB656|nr:EAL domain-containing protein [Pseudomonas sp. S10E 269]